MKTLIMPIGLPRSGKTTWARQNGNPIVSPDEIRLALHGQRFAAEAEPFVWAIAQVMVKALFAAGHDYVILDATNITRKRREVWRSELWRREFVVAGATKEQCIERAMKLGDSEIIPVIERMAAEYEPLSPEEDDYEQA
jgi:predicted kinase